MNLRTVGIGLLGLLLAVVSVPYLGRGYRELVRNEQDLRRRWIECRYVIHGQDPFQPKLGQMHGPDPAANRRECDRLASLYGVPDMPDYPPWSYAPMLIFVWPPAAVLPYYYAVFDTLGIAVLVAGLLAIVRPVGRVQTFAVAVSGLAVSAVCSTMVNGNFGIIVVAAALLSLGFDRRNRPLPAGVFLWIALLKPTISLPLAVPFLLRGRWRTLAVAGTLVVLGCALPWGSDHVNPAEMMREAVTAAREFEVTGYGPIKWLAMLRVPANLTTPITAAAFSIPTAAFLVARRDLPDWKQLAILSVAGRLWAYHLAHDNVMLIFLLAAVWRLFLARATPVTTAALVLVGGSLWMPSRLAMHESVGVVHILVWVAGAIYVAAYRPAADERTVPVGAVAVA